MFGADGVLDGADCEAEGADREAEGADCDAEGADRDCECDRASEADADADTDADADADRASTLFDEAREAFSLRDEERDFDRDREDRDARSGAGSTVLREVPRGGVASASCGGATTRGAVGTAENDDDSAGRGAG